MVKVNGCALVLHFGSYKCSKLSTMVCQELCDLKYWWLLASNQKLSLAMRTIENQDLAHQHPNIASALPQPMSKFNGYKIKKKSIISP